MQPPVPASSASFELKPRQVAHYERIEKILSTNYAALDSSPTGAGKSFIVLEYARRNGLAICVICPLAVVQNWKNYCAMYGITLITAITYQSLRGTKGKTNNPLLKVVGDTYLPSDYFRSWAAHGMLLVYDEAQNLMNESLQSRAAHCLTRTIMQDGPCSRILALSAAPASREKNCFPLMKALGICKHFELYYYDKGTAQYEDLGYAEIKKKANEINPALAREIADSLPLKRSTANQLCFAFFSKILLPPIRSSMPKPELDVELDAKLCRYHFPPNDVEDLKSAYAAIRAAVSYGPNGGMTLKGNITGPCRRIGLASAPTIARLVRKDMARGFKVVIFSEYDDVTRLLCELLGDFFPTPLNGKVKQADRTTIVEKFQQPNWDSRIIVSHPKVGGVGVNLDDQHGSFPRKCYLIPSYYFLDTIQASGRIYRTLTKSRAVVRIVECIEFSENTKIIDSILRKTDVLKSLLNNSQGMLLPGDYPSIVEDQDN